MARKYLKVKLEDRVVFLVEDENKSNPKAPDFREVDGKSVAWLNEQKG